MTEEKVKKHRKFDVIIGNPPYQETDGGAGASATPLYNKMIDSTKKLDPNIMSYIIPAKWYSGGKGLNSFREEMLNDHHIVSLEDYSDSRDVFPNVDIAGGVCFFIRDKNYSGKCKYTNHFKTKTITQMRDLSATDTFIRYPLAAEIVEKANKLKEKTLYDLVCVRKPFGLPSSARPIENGDIILRYHGGKGSYLRSKVSAGQTMIDQWKIIISKLTAEHAGQPDKNGQFRVLSTLEELKPQEVCSETYLVAGAFDTKNEADNYMAYLKTKFVRFLIHQIAITQNLSRSTFKYVPCQDFKQTWSDEKLFDKYNLTDDEIAFINKEIKEMK